MIENFLDMWDALSHRSEENYFINEFSTFFLILFKCLSQYFIIW